MQFFYITQHVALLIAILIVCISIAKSYSSPVRYYTFLSLVVCLYSIGYFLEISAQSYEYALLAFRLKNTSLPFLGPLLYLFSRDYFQRPIRNPKLITAMLFPAFITAFGINSSHFIHYYFKTIEFITKPLPHLYVKPGIFYYGIILYTTLFIAAGFITTLRSVILAKSVWRLRSIVLFSASFLPLLALILQHSSFLPSGVDLVPSLMVVSLLILGGYILRFRSTEWLPYARESVLEHINDGFLLLTMQGELLDANTVARYYFPELRNTVAGAPISQIARFPNSLLHGQTPTYDFTVEVNKEIIYLRASSTTIYYNRKAVCISILIFDISETHLLMQELNELATHDTLTGLLNRGTFFKYATRDFDLAKRNKNSCAILMLDIDYFKTVNDRYGHLCGDTVLITLSGIIRDRLRHTDILGRYGGEEIAVFLPHANKTSAYLVAEIIRSSIEEYVFTYGEETLSVTASIGVAIIKPEQHDSIEHMLADADTALYLAKNTGRNRVCLSKNTN